MRTQALNVAVPVLQDVVMGVANNNSPEDIARVTLKNNIDKLFDQKVKKNVGGIVFKSLKMTVGKKSAMRLKQQIKPFAKSSKKVFDMAMRIAPIALTIGAVALTAAAPAFPAGLAIAPFLLIGAKAASNYNKDRQERQATKSQMTKLEHHLTSQFDKTLKSLNTKSEKLEVQLSQHPALSMTEISQIKSELQEIKSEKDILQTKSAGALLAEVKILKKEYRANPTPTNLERLNEKKREKKALLKNIMQEQLDVKTQRAGSK